MCVSIELNMASSPLPSPLDRCFSAFCINQNQQQIELTKLAKGVSECQARGGGGVDGGVCCGIFITKEQNILLLPLCLFSLLLL